MSPESRRIAERLMEDPNFKLQDILTLFIAYSIDEEVIDRTGKDATLDGAEFMAKLEKMVGHTIEDLLEEDKEQRRLA